MIWLSLAIGAGLAGLTAWLAFLAALALASRAARACPETPLPGGGTRLAVLIPAHDEEMLVAGTVRAVLGSTLAREDYEVFVVADNCRDATAERAAAAGANCLVRRDEARRGKGYALRFGLEEIARAGDFLAVVFFDADSTPAPDFLTRMAGWVAAGKQVIQGRYEVADPDRTWFTRLTRMTFSLKNRWQYPGLGRWGLSVPLRGSGMCLAAPVLERFVWGGDSLTEDLELAVALEEAGVRTFYDHLAVTGQYMPPDPAAAACQRRRWSAGEMQLARKRLWRLVGKRVRRGRMKAALYGLYLCAPPFSLNLLACVALAVLAAGVALAGGPATTLWGAAALLAAHAGYFCLGLPGDGSRGRYLAALAMIPAYAVWRVTIHAGALCGRLRGWERTPRD